MNVRVVVGYSLSQRFLHWATVLLVLFNLLLPDGMNAWQRLVRHGGTPSPEQIASANIHAYVGIAILLMTVLRLGLRFVQGVPLKASDEPAIFRFAARLAHASLYLLLLALPASGIAVYYFGAQALGSLHADVLKLILWIVIVAHVFGALVHQFYWKTDVLRRMTVG
ncbi:cytochrome b561 [Rhizobium sp. BK196]|jgi:cytochrome b561|uniref:cytochrome b n=1 Tax=Rhizobium sp. BK196 TaxID=2587073 RepID=UPI001612A010|nr:cytochrome b/b6 domain-containing protein [Rhizobium sp. BK196]MBB3313573.1 cytochrome b561 [Rhizobium sp. BK196]